MLGLLGLACAAVVSGKDLEVDDAEPAPAGPIAITPDVVKPAEPPPLAPAGTTSPTAETRCIDDVLDDAVVRGVEAHGWSAVSRGDLSAWPLADVDGDGQEEEIVTAEYECGVTGNCPLLLYRSDGGCASFAGSFWSSGEGVLPRRHRGLRDLQVWLKGGCVGLEGSVVRLAWNGDRYEEIGRIECDCDASDPGRDPACPEA